MQKPPSIFQQHFYKKYSYLWIIIVAGIFFAAKPMLMAPGISNPEPINGYLNGVFPNQVPTGSTNSEISYSIENAFPNLTFVDPVDMVEMPGGNEFLVVGLQGHVWKFNNNPNTSNKTLLLDISKNTLVDTDGGMLGIALHPEYGQAGSPNSEYIYIFYRYSPDPSFDNDFTGAALTGYMRLSRFRLPQGANSINPSSEYVMMQIFDRHDWHNGGDMFFGNDNFLYLVVGDEGAANDSYNVTQQIDKWLFGGILRIDVDRKGGSISHPIRKQPLDAGSPPAGWPSSFTQGYYIPNDNPWLDPNGGILEEFYAIGTRSPHRMAYDPQTGDIWIGDVGQGTMEEINVARKGDNMQWPYREGKAAGSKPKPTSIIGNDRPPIHAYERTIGRCVIGGFVYRGNRYPELNGKYLFGDHETQNVWTLERTGENTGNTSILLNVPVVGVGSKDGISSFYKDSNGYVYILDLFGTNRDGGVIHKLIRTDGIQDPPERLSDLGVFTNMQTLETAKGIIPYDVNAPLWSDRAKKRRWIAIPNNGSHNTAAEQIIFDTEENWKFPAGTVMIKHFDLPINQRNPSQLRKLETRFVVFTQDGEAYGVTYKWNNAGTEAFLVGIDDAPTEDYTITASDGSTYSQKWEFPSRQQCMQCHNSVAGYALGIKSRQLNRDFTYPSTGITANQLETWEHLGIFNENIGSYQQIPALANIKDGTSSEEMRVRSYIDANCAYCHRPNGVEGAFDARSLTALYDQNMVGTLAISHASPNGLNIVEPNNPEASVLWVRDGSTGADKMPPLGRSLSDDDYIKVLTSWITGLNNDGPTSVEDGWYTLQARHSGLTLTVENASIEDNARIVQEVTNPADEQKWYIQDMGGKKYRITSGLSNKVLAVNDLRANRGANIVQKEWTGGQHQLWYFESVGQSHFKIKNAYNNLDFDIFSGATTGGLHSITWTPHGGQNQQFLLTPTESPLACANQIETILSDLDWDSATAGWGIVRKNTGINGGIMTINGKTYDNGIAAHAQSEITYTLNGAYNSFSSEIGINDTAPNRSQASVQFEVRGDGETLYLSPMMTAKDDALPIEVNIMGITELKLVAHELPENSPSADPDSFDHANWANAKLKACMGNNIIGEVGTASMLSGKNETIVNDSSLRWIDFSAVSTSHTIDFEWSVENQQEIVTYQIERSLKGKEFTLVSDQSGVSDNTIGIYKGIDENPSIGKNYYRIAAIHKNGDIEYSYIMGITHEKPGVTVLAYPNPVGRGQILTTDIRSEKLDLLDIRIYDLQGRLIESRKSKMETPQMFEQFDVSNLRAGIYLIQVSGEFWSVTKRVIVK